MTAPKILGMGNSMRTFPIGPTSKIGRRASLLVWATPNPIKRVRTMGNGRKILVNRGDVILRGDARS